MQELFFRGFSMPHSNSGPPGPNPFTHPPGPNPYTHQPTLPKQSAAPFHIHAVHGVDPISGGSSKDFNDRYQKSIGGAGPVKNNGCGNTKIGQYKL